MERFLLILSATVLSVSTAFADQEIQPTKELNNNSIISIEEAFIDADSNGVYDRMNEMVVIAGRSNFASHMISDKYLNSYVQDKTGGVLIYSQDPIYNFGLGDSLVVKGRVFKFRGMPEIIVEDIVVIYSEPKSPPAANLALIHNNLDDYLGTVVAGEFILLSKEYLDSGSIRLKVSSVSGKSKEFNVYLRQYQVNNFGFNFDRYSIGERLSITGVISRFDNANNAEGLIQIYPRYPKEIYVIGIPTNVFIFIAFGFVGLVIGVVAWNYSLRKKIEQHTYEINTSLKEKTVLLNEIHHRVKNNLAVVSGFLQLEMMKGNHNDGVKRVLDENILRIKSMGYIHEQLYKSQDFSSINMEDYIKVLANEISNTYCPGDKNIDLVISCDKINLNMNQAIPCALTINELLSNAYKHAFKGFKRGTIDICIIDQGSEIFVKVQDDGIGLPKDINLEYSDSLGMLLVHQFVAQLDSELKYKNTIGSTFSFVFTKDESAYITSAVV
ncbi:MAG: sensor histidine kinase [Balneolaceae bacterium]|nr:sensor histidine kinase [Balneolaceae bacterium]